MGGRVRAGLAAVWLAAAAGCQTEPEYAPVTGTVVLDGVPLLGKDVEFVPDGETAGLGSLGNTMGDGRYTLVATRAGAVTETFGVRPGTYRVVVCEPRLGPVEFSAQPAGPGDAPAAAVGPNDPSLKKSAARPRQPVPAVYTKPETTPLRVEVPPNGGTFDLKLESKAK